MFVLELPKILDLRSAGHFSPSLTNVATIIRFCRLKLEQNENNNSNVVHLVFNAFKPQNI